MGIPLVSLDLESPGFRVRRGLELPGTLDGDPKAIRLN